MVTYSDLIQIGLLVVGIIGLFLASKKQKWPPLRPKSAVTSVLISKGWPSIGSTFSMFILPRILKKSIIFLKKFLTICSCFDSIVKRAFGDPRGAVFFMIWGGSTNSVAPLYIMLVWWRHERFDLPVWCSLDLHGCTSVRLRLCPCGLAFLTRWQYRRR